MALARRRAGGPLWAFELRGARDAFEASVRSLQLVRFEPVLYSGRHTGASLDRYEDRRSLAEVQQRGRWRTTTSVRRYEKRGMVQHAWSLLSLAVQSRCQHAERVLPGALCARFGTSA